MQAKERNEKKALKAKGAELIKKVLEYGDLPTVEYPTYRITKHGWHTSYDLNFPRAPVFDDCDVVRKKISNWLAKGYSTQARLLEVIRPSEKIAVTGIHTFMKKSGVDGGADCIVYKYAYEFFEKLRLVQNESKSEARKRFEAQYPHGWSLLDSDKMKTLTFN